MSLSIVRKGLELSSELSIVNKKAGKKGKNNKIVKHSKKKTPEEIKRDNLKLILGLDNALSLGIANTTTNLVKKGSKNQSKSINLPDPVKDKQKQDQSSFTGPEVEIATGKKGKKKSKTKQKQTKKKNQDSSIFTEEDFEKFEKEYFVTG